MQLSPNNLLVKDFCLVFFSESIFLFFLHFLVAADILLGFFSLKLSETSQMLTSFKGLYKQSPLSSNWLKEATLNYKK